MIEAKHFKQSELAASRVLVFKVKPAGVPGFAHQIGALPDAEQKLGSSVPICGAEASKRLGAGLF